MTAREQIRALHTRISRSIIGQEHIVEQWSRRIAMMRCQNMSVVVVGLLLGVLAFPGRAAAQVDEFEGILMSTAAFGGAGIVPFTLRIEQYTTEVDRLALINGLRDEGWRWLESALLKEEKGRLLISGQPAVIVGFARSQTHEGGRVIRVATAINIGSFRDDSRFDGHVFGMIELTLDNEGNGTGRVIAAAKLDFNERGQLRLESYSQPPFSITQVSVKR
jgi:hypothetical protein